MLQLELPGDIFIDVGWYPDWDPNGEYRVAVFYDEFENLLEPMFRSTDAQAVAAHVRRMLAKYNRPTLAKARAQEAAHKRGIYPPVVSMQATTTPPPLFDGHGGVITSQANTAYAPVIAF
jgi:hypothetical protein